MERFRIEAFWFIRRQILIRLRQMLKQKSEKMRGNNRELFQTNFDILFCFWFVFRWIPKRCVNSNCIGAVSFYNIKTSRNVVIVRSAENSKPSNRRERIENKPEKNDKLRQYYNVREMGENKAQSETYVLCLSTPVTKLFYSRIFHTYTHTHIVCE